MSWRLFALTSDQVNPTPLAANSSPFVIKLPNAKEDRESENRAEAMIRRCSVSTVLTAPTLHHPTGYCKGFIILLNTRRQYTPRPLLNWHATGERFTRQSSQRAYSRSHASEACPPV